MVGFAWPSNFVQIIVVIFRLVIQDILAAFVPSSRVLSTYLLFSFVDFQILLLISSFNLILFSLSEISFCELHDLQQCYLLYLEKFQMGDWYFSFLNKLFFLVYTIKIWLKIWFIFK